jgi:hypothetical protein
MKPRSNVIEQMEKLWAKANTIVAVAKSLTTIPLEGG